MKHRGKNKKKQWRYSMPNIENALETLSQKENIENDDFVLSSGNILSKCIIKGDKNSCKDFPSFGPSSSTVIRNRKVRPKRSKMSVKRRIIDLWSDENVVPLKRNTFTKPKLDPPPVPGQSYNPSIEDHQNLLASICKSLEPDEKTDKRIQKFQKEISHAKKTIDPIDIARQYFKGGTVTIKEEPSDDELIGSKQVEQQKKRKKKRVDLETQKSRDIDKIPSLLKEMRREKAQRTLRKEVKKVKIANKKALESRKKLDFQLPSQLAASLREMQPEGNILRDVERLRDGAMRKRTTIQNATKRKSFNRKL